MVKQEGVLTLAVAAAVLVTEVGPVLLCNPVQHRLSKQGQEMLDGCLQLLFALITGTKSLHTCTASSVAL